MGQFSSRARGLWHDTAKSAIAAQSLVGMDFLISKVGANFVEGDCNAAYAAKIPFGLFFEANPDYYKFYPINDYEKWPDINYDHTLKYLDSYIMMGTAKRAIHFIVMDCSQTKYPDGTDISPVWIVATGKRLLDLLWKKYQLPVYVYMNQSPMAAAQNNPNGLEALNMFANRDGQSTYTKVPVGADGYPDDGTKPVLAYDGGKPWGFWLYSPLAAGIYTISSKTKEELYTQLKYALPAVIPVSGSSTATQADMSVVLERLSQIQSITQTDLSAIQTALTQCVTEEDISGILARLADIEASEDANKELLLAKITEIGAQVTNMKSQFDNLTVNLTNAIGKINAVHTYLTTHIK